MITAFVTASLGASTGLTHAEHAMIDALRDRNVPAIRKLIGNQIPLFTILPGSEAHIEPERLTENYLVLSDSLTKNSTATEIRIKTERLSKIISISLSKPEFNPVALKSIHNDLSKHTIRGLIAPQVYWEMHYDVAKNGRLRLRRVCEFDHSPKFVW